MKIERIHYRGWPEAYRCALGPVELVVVTSIGPRILSLRLEGGENVLYEDETGFGVGAWRLYGGHRFVTAPENSGTYTPDNRPCEAQASHGRLQIRQPPDAEGLQKTLTIGPGLSGSGFEIVHGIANRNRRVWHGALWACTCVKPDGRVVISRPSPVDSPPHRLDVTGACASDPQELGTPVGNVRFVADSQGACYWTVAGCDYAGPTSPQWGWTNGQFVVRPPLARGKVGLLSSEGCLALVRPDLTFVIRATDVHPHLQHPHGGCNVEVYTSSQYLEMETLGPLNSLAPGQETVHRQQWQILPSARVHAEHLMSRQTPELNPPCTATCQPAHE
jgi:hypothetical protein